jgi:hypothetical protein
MFQRIAFLLLVIYSSPALWSQSRVGTWEDHLSLNSCISVAKVGSKVYGCNYSGIVIYDSDDNSIKKLNRINGLSDVGIRLLRENPHNNRLMVIYDNSNIDIITSDDKVLNYSDLFRKNFSGKKNINEVYYSGKMAYLACGFGIALFDTEKLEIKETYIIGPGGTNLEVYQITMTDSLIYAATPNGLFQCNYKTKILSNYQNWKLSNPSLPTGTYANVVIYNNTLLTSFSPYKQSGLYGKDTIYMFSNNTWSKFPYLGHPYIVKKFKVFGDKLGIAETYGSLFLNTNWAISAYITQYYNKYTFVNDLCFDGNNYWIADQGNGLIKTGGSNPYYAPTFIPVNGINSSNISNIAIEKGKVAIAPINIESGGGATGSKAGIDINIKGDWTYLRREGTTGDTLIDLCHVLIDKKDTSRMWVSSWVQGLFEFKNNQFVKAHTGNTTGGVITPILPNWWRVSGKDMDKDGNLWFAVSDITKYLCVKRTDDVFQSFAFDGAARFVRKVFCDKNDQIWILHERDQGLTVCKANRNPGNYSISNYKILNKNVGSGNLGSNSVFSIAEDQDGKIWVGTSTGLRVFNSPGNIFNGGSVDGEPIKIVQDGNVELLLESEVVTCIDVDGGNNKWIGTQAGGVYCFSPDGQRQLQHFTTENSPLYSNEVIDLKYNGKTGDIFIGTGMGLQSYKSVIMDGNENYSGIYAYPNPIKPGYTGNLYITGLVDNSIVKISDESGNFVWETKSQGGRVEWPLKTFAGNKVSSGVYTIYAATTTAELKAVTKVLVLN